MRARHDQKGGSTLVVVAALAGNACIALAKFAAFAFTGSAAILTEAIHSLVDTGNQALMFLGLRLSRRPPDEDHPFGYGMEVYFWSFVVALLIFAIGGVVSLWEGVEKLREPAQITRPWVNFLVIGVAAVFESASLTVAAREFNRARRSCGVLRSMRRSKDPTVFAVLLEDSAALAGLAVAALGLLAAVQFDLPWADGAASCVIGLMLMLVAAFLTRETRSLLIGESASVTVVDAIRAVLAREPRIDQTREIRSLHVGPDRIVVGLSVRFSPRLDRLELDGAIRETAAAVAAVDARIGEVFLRPDSAAG